MAHRWNSGLTVLSRHRHSIDISPAKEVFPRVANLRALGGPIDILIWLNHIDEAPREHKRDQDLYKSVSDLGSWYAVICWWHCHYAQARRSMAKLLSCRSTMFTFPKFISAEAMGTKLSMHC